MRSVLIVLVPISVLYMCAPRIAAREVPSPSNRLASSCSPRVSNEPIASSPVETRGVHVLKGQEASAHVRDLMNRPIGTQLRIAFDKLAAAKGVKVDVSKAWGVRSSGKVNTAFETLGHPQVHLAPVSLSAVQSFSISDGTYDFEWFPADSEANYWAGTFYASYTDDTGTVVAEEIINVEQQYILDNAQGWTTTYEHLTYGRDERGPRQALVGSNPGLVLASFNRASSYGSRPLGVHWKGHYGDWLGCGTSWCAGSAGGCALANWWDAEIAWAPCTGAGCIAGFTGCAWGTLFGV